MATDASPRTPTTTPAILPIPVGVAISKGEAAAAAAVVSVVSVLMGGRIVVLFVVVAEGV